MHYYPIGVLVVSCVFYLWDEYLDLRQYRVYKRTEKVPKELEGLINHETFEKSKSYSIDKARFGFLCGIFVQIQTIAKIYFFVIPYFWNLSSDLMESSLGFTKSRTIEWEIFQSLVFTLVTSLISSIINLPISIYFNFVIEERHGFNKQTAGFYARDQLKKFAFAYVLTAPIIVVMIYIVRYGGPYFFLYLWIFLALVTGLLTFFSGEIAALFDKVVPLPEGELRKRIEELSKSIKFPLSNVFLVKGSKRSSHSNAYQAGILNKKRIVLYDTLLKGHVEQDDTEAHERAETKEEDPEKHMSYDEILAVVCHELGHWHCGHLMKNLIFAQANIFFVFVIFSKMYKDPTIFAAFGFTDEMPVVIGLALVMMILEPYNKLEGFIATQMTRRFEYQADEFAGKRGYVKDLKTALVKLNDDNLGFPVHDELFSKFNHSHPTLIQRLNALDKKTQ